MFCFDFIFILNLESFKTKHQLRNHSIMHEENYTPFVCSFCAASFRRKSTLNVHMRSHTNVCPYTCRYCGKSFRHGITLQVSYIWWGGCWNPLSLKNCFSIAFQTHERSHTNDKPYGCTICEYRCTSKGNLNKHMMRAHCKNNHTQPMKYEIIPPLLTVSY